MKILRLTGCLRVATVAISVVIATGAAAAHDVPTEAPAAPVTSEAPLVTLFENVRIFSGTSTALSPLSNVLVRGNLIETISTAPIDLEPGDEVQIIDGDERVLMPGLIDAHWHAILVRPNPVQGLSWDMGYTTLVAAEEAEATLMRGFTTVRDLGGPTFSLKRAIDEGMIVGPRIYPSGAMISVTGGHGDFRELHELPRAIGELARMEELGMSMIADTPDEVRIRAREQLMQGASQVKLTAGGGVASPFSPLDVSTFTDAEIRAAVEAAENWGTYVGAHAYTPETIQRAINAGVKVIEHGHLMDEETAQLMAETGTWLSIQPFLEGVDATIPLSASSRARLQQVLTGTDVAYNLAKQYNIKTAFGTDVLFSEAAARLQGHTLTLLTRWYTPGEVLQMATASNGELLQLSGLRNPYPGRLGVVEEDALADLILVDGNPLDNIDLIADAATNFVVIMKDGQIYKNTLPDQAAP